MSGYIGNIPAVEATQVRQSFTATSGQTSFATLGYTPNYLDVYLNGVKLEDGVDFTATNGSDIVLTVGATAGDTVEMVAFSTFQSAELATVAITGDYGDLLNTPAPFDPNTLATVATTGSYTDLSNVPANIVTDAAYVHTDNNYTTTEKSKLAGVEAGATADQTAAEILTAIKTVDGAGSGLDADTLDGQHASAFALASHGHNYAGSSSDGGIAYDANAVVITGYGTSEFTFHQTDQNLQTWTGGWASHLISNHGDGSSYYNQTIIMPFWGAPQYMRKEGGTNKGPWQFWTSENFTPPSTNTGAVGSYAYMARYGGLSAGSTYAGSELYYGGVIHWGMAANTRQDTVNTWRSSSTGAGTWRAMGTSLTSTGGQGGGTLCVRIS